MARQIRPSRNHAGTGLAIRCAGPAPGWPALGEDESYVLDVTPAGARLEAPTATGALRGMATFSQLIEIGAEGSEVPAVHIEDRPRFAWRGLMMDVSRHWMPVEVVERNLEAMAALKLNVFHWHLSDDQGFRIESRLYPRLQQFGSDGNFYTQEQVREVVAFARDRGIRVVPEFDMPGHMTSWFVGMPELATAPGPFQIARTWGVLPAVMNTANNSTYTFLEAFFGEMAGLFPDAYFHIGGDEVADPLARLQQPAFNLRLQALLKQKGKILVGWEEVLAPGLASDAVIQAWRSSNALTDAVRQGHPAILSYGYYLDHLQTAGYHYSVDPGTAAGVLGGEACMWAEYVSSETVDSRIWPRMAAIAERFWSPAETNDPNSMYARLAPVSRWLELAGVQHRANYLPMLERLAAGRPVDALRVLADASEATGIDVRRTHPYTSLTPLDRFVDAARPETEPVDLGRIREQLQEWVDNEARFQGPDELVPLSRNLKTVGEIGLQALQYRENCQAPPADWVAQQNQVLNALQVPVAEVVLAAIRPVRLLLGPRTMEVPAVRNTSAADCVPTKESLPIL
jgi:hexosaminidase